MIDKERIKLLEFSFEYVEKIILKTFCDDENEMREKIVKEVAALKKDALNKKELEAIKLAKAKLDGLTHAEISELYEILSD